MWPTKRYHVINQRGTNTITIESMSICIPWDVNEFIDQISKLFIDCHYIIKIYPLNYVSLCLVYR